MAIGDLGPGGLDSWGWIVMKGVRTHRIPNHPPTPPIYHYIVECKHIVVFGSPPKEPTDAFHRAGGFMFGTCAPCRSFDKNMVKEKCGKYAAL